MPTYRSWQGARSLFQEFLPVLALVHDQLLNPSEEWKLLITEIEQQLPADMRKVLILKRLKLSRARVATELELDPATVSERWSRLRLFVLLKAVKSGLVRL